MNDTATTNKQLTPQQQAALGPREMDRAFADLVSHYHNAVVQDGGELVTERRLLAGDRDALLARRRELEAAILRPKVALAEIEKQVSFLMTKFAGPKLDDAQAKVTTKSYATTLLGLPLWAIRRTFEQIALGRLPEVSLDYRPSAPRLRVAVEESLGRYYEEHQRISRVLEAKLIEPVGDEERQRVREATTAWLTRADPDAAAMAAVGERIDESQKASQEAAVRRSNDYFLARERAPSAGPIPVSSALLAAMGVKATRGAE